jgi:hypothetical protein
LQEDFVDLADVRSCINVSGLLLERIAPGHHGYISASIPIAEVIRRKEAGIGSSAKRHGPMALICPPDVSAGSKLRSSC